MGGERKHLARSKGGKLQGWRRGAHGPNSDGAAGRLAAENWPSATGAPRRRRGENKAGDGFVVKRLK
jgi:hypothetical protein